MVCRAQLVLLVPGVESKHVVPFQACACVVGSSTSFFDVG